MCTINGMTFRAPLCMYDVTFWRFRATIVEEEQYVLHILSVCL
jgi:hypothetical protein